MIEQESDTLAKFKDILGNNWVKKDKIIEKYKTAYGIDLNEREWRLMVANFNKEYNAHLTNGYDIVHSNKGYRLTNDYDEMRKSDNDLYKRSMKMLARVSKNKKTRGEDMHAFRLELVQDIKKATDSTIAVTKI
jgi:hypothetical protein